MVTSEVIRGLIEVPGGYYEVEFHPEPDGGYIAVIPSLGGCATQGDTLEEAIAMAKDAAEGWLAVARQEGLKIPEPMKRVATLDIAA
jgi:antitoxin HicB